MCARNSFFVQALHNSLKDSVFPWKILLRSSPRLKASRVLSQSNFVFKREDLKNNLEMQFKRSKIAVRFESPLFKKFSARFGK